MSFSLIHTFAPHWAHSFSNPGSRWRWYDSPSSWQTSGPITSSGWKFKLRAATLCRGSIPRLNGHSRLVGRACVVIPHRLHLAVDLVLCCCPWKKKVRTKEGKQFRIYLRGCISHTIRIQGALPGSGSHMSGWTASTWVRDRFLDRFLNRNFESWEIWASFLFTSVLSLIRTLRWFKGQCACVIRKCEIEPHAHATAVLGILLNGNNETKT